MDRGLFWQRSIEGRSEKSIEDKEDNKVSHTNDMLGKHCILELYQCDLFRLNDEAFIRTIINSAARISGATLLNLITHKFEPQGITGLALLAESHISIHTWPEHGYAAVDVFTCGEHTSPEIACEVIYNELLAQRYSFKVLNREVPAEISRQVRRPVSF